MYDVEKLISAYKQGYFPMADAESGNICLYFAEPRAIFPFQHLRPGRSLTNFMKKTPFNITINHSFPAVIKACAARNETWISTAMVDTYCELHFAGWAHSIEVWQDNKIVGGLYGVAIGGAFFGESMFNFVPNAAKVAFYYLVEQLKAQKFVLLDSQYINDFTRQLGAIEIPCSKYLSLLEHAIVLERTFV